MTFITDGFAVARMPRSGLSTIRHHQALPCTGFRMTRH